jgi:excisionase family DNA binding protein
VKTLTAREAAELLSISKARCYELARQNVIPHFRLNRQVRFDEGQLREFIAAGGKRLNGGWKHEADD